MTQNETPNERVEMLPALSRKIYDLIIELAEEGDPNLAIVTYNYREFLHHAALAWNEFTFGEEGIPDFNTPQRVTMLEGKFSYLVKRHAARVAAHEELAKRVAALEETINALTHNVNYSLDQCRELPLLKERIQQLEEDARREASNQQEQSERRGWDDMS